MLYFAVIAVTTLRLNRYFRNPNTTMLIVLGAMFIVPMLVRQFRSANGGNLEVARGVGVK